MTTNLVGFPGEFSRRILPESNLNVAVLIFPEISNFSYLALAVYRSCPSEAYIMSVILRFTF